MTKNLIPLLDAMMVHKNNIVSAKSSEILSCIKDKIINELFNYEEESEGFKEFMLNAPDRLENPFTNEIVLSYSRDKSGSSIGSSNNNESPDSLLCHKRERRESLKCKEMNNVRLRKRNNRSDLDSVNITQSNITIGSNSVRTRSKEEISIHEESSSNIITRLPKPVEDTSKSNVNKPRQNSNSCLSSKNDKITDNTRRHSPNNHILETEIDQYLVKISNPSYNILETKKIDSFLDKLFSIFHHSRVQLNEYSIKLLLSRVFDNSQVMEFSLDKVDSPLECLKNLKPYENFYKYEYSKFNKLSSIKHYMRKCLCIKYKKLFIRLVRSFLTIAS